VPHSIANYRGPALSGDFTIQTAEVVDKQIDEDRRSIVAVKHRMANQRDSVLCTGTAELIPPKRPAAQGTARRAERRCRLRTSCARRSERGVLMQVCRAALAPGPSPERRLDRAARAPDDRSCPAAAHSPF
jgi:hypothetical protein